ncbi:hypothetical protein P0L94_08105 [Microbacter sp. GSS18]|nr:hypothetical protein P0L94_08105 [Microbacter sp. GSS18]
MDGVAAGAMIATGALGVALVVFLPFLVLTLFRRGLAGVVRAAVTVTMLVAALIVTASMLAGRIPGDLGGVLGA